MRQGNVCDERNGKNDTSSLIYAACRGLGVEMISESLCSIWYLFVCNAIFLSSLYSDYSNSHFRRHNPAMEQRDSISAFRGTRTSRVLRGVSNAFSRPEQSEFSALNNSALFNFRTITIEAIRTRPRPSLPIFNTKFIATPIHILIIYRVKNYRSSFI